MNMEMPDMKKMKKAVKQANALQLSMSMDAGMKLKRKNELHAIKSFAIHKSCNIPVLRAALILIGIMAVMAVWICVKKKMKCGGR